MVNLAETVHEGLEALLRLKDTQRALVATISNGQLVVQSIHSLHPGELDAASPVTTVLAQVQKQAKGLLVLDAEQENVLFSSVPEERRKELRSAVCVPVLGESDRMLGILYADSRARVGNFSYGDLNQLQSTAQELAPRLAASLAEVAAGTRPASEPVVGVYHLRIFAGLLAVAVLWFIIGAFRSSPPAQPPPPTPAAGVATAAPPYIVTSFLGMLSTGDVGHLDRVLSEDMRRRWPPDRLSAQLRSWLSDPSHRADLNYRVVRPGTGVAVGNTAKVIVDTQEPTEYEEKRNRTRVRLSRARQLYWTFNLKKYGSSWLIDGMEGPPDTYDPLNLPKILVPLPEQGPWGSP